MRACCIVYVNFANIEEERCIDICSTCVKSSERFVQLGVGCLLREMSFNSTERVISFIYDNYRYFTREGLRYSIEKLDVNTRKKILSIGKGRTSTRDQNDSPSPPPQNQTNQRTREVDNKQNSNGNRQNGNATEDSMYQQYYSMNYMEGPPTRTLPLVMPTNYSVQPQMMMNPNYRQYYDMQSYNQNNYPHQ